MAKMPSVMSHNFSQVPRAEIPRSSFDRSHGHKTTFNAGLLIPIFVDEALPGDTFSLNMTCFARLATPLHPIMDNMYLNSFFFAVPLRLVWNNFQKFMGEQDNPGDSTDYLVPQMNVSSQHDTGTIYDYMGLPVFGANGIAANAYAHSSLPLRAYNLIYNTWFRDQNLQNSVIVNKGDTNDSPGNYTLLRRGKRHDYFTSALPWPQKGPGATIPLGTSATVRTSPTELVSGSQSGSVWRLTTGGYPAANTAAFTATGGFGPTGTAGAVTTGAYPANLYADLTTASAATINQLRQAFQLQKLYERDARGGSRYTEIIRAHFNVLSPDARLQRPEYLGGGQSPVNLYSVPQTSGTAGTGGYTNTPQGNLAAYGTVSGSGHGFTKSFTEHCVILGLVCVRADLTYQAGLNRMWSRRTKYDFYWPALSHIGEQAILNKEIWVDNVPADNDAVFGYQERYAEYRYKPSQITGEFRSSFATSLDTWHLSQDFTTRPVLNAAFIEERPPIDRVVAVTTEPQFIFDSYFRLRCARPMPIYGVPGNIDRF